MAVLPIYEIQSGMVDALREANRLVISAPTGSGKSTQVPQILRDSGILGDAEVVVLQPRRIAARLLARRVASERQSRLGAEIGYQVRFENVTSGATRIRYVTEGVLLRRMIVEPQLRGVSAVIFDEFHERHLHGDVTLAMALELQEATRKDLRIVVMSATLAIDVIEQYLAPCRVLVSEGRQFSVQINYATTPSYVEKRPVWQQAADAFAEYVKEGGEGDVLVFMPGGYEISETIRAIRACEEARGFVVLPLYGDLPPGQQDAAVQAYQQRKVVVATNVAETSLTIEGIRCVIDSGLARLPRYDSYRGINTLLVEKISRASADQRAGRAGRTAPGVCFRLWTREEHAHRPAQELPEVKRLDLTEVVLTLKAAGIADLNQFRWLEPPEKSGLNKAEELLTDLGAIERSAAAGTSLITALGRRMLAFPLHPRYSRMLIAAEEFHCVRAACLVAALTQGKDLLLRNVDAPVASRRCDFADPVLGDFGRLMRIWEEGRRRDFAQSFCQDLGVNATAARQVQPLLEQFLEIARRENLTLENQNAAAERLAKCILLGFSDRVARRLDGRGARYELAHGRTATLDRESLVGESRFIVAAEVRELEAGDDVAIRLSLALPVREAWISELLAGAIQESTRVFFDSGTRRVCAEKRQVFRGLSLAASPIEPPVDEAARLLADEVVSGRAELPAWDESVEHWILRVNLLGKWCPELGIPPITAEDRRMLVEQICHGSAGVKDLRDKPVRETVKGWLSATQQELIEKHAPERITLANGRWAKVHYHAANPPYIALRIQQLFGVNQAPAIGMNRVPLLVHILAPSMRPVQVTQDLKRFWSEHYPRIKQELQRKYPKHEWR